MSETHQLIQHKKAQVAVLDLFIAALIFGILVSAIMVTWNNYNVKIDQRIEDNTNLIRAYHISDLLVRYPGKPTAWETYPELIGDSISIIGLAKSDGVIDPVKLSEFTKLENDFIKDKLKTGHYDFYFKLVQIDGSHFTPPIEKGNLTNSSTSIALRRYVIYNETEAILEFHLQR